jgi:glycopeptide antibiotics resistance protein
MLSVICPVAGERERDRQTDKDRDRETEKGRSHNFHYSSWLYYMVMIYLLMLISYCAIFIIKLYHKYISVGKIVYVGFSTFFSFR